LKTWLLIFIQFLLNSILCLFISTIDMRAQPAGASAKSAPAATGATAATGAPAQCPDKEAFTGSIAGIADLRAQAADLRAQAADMQAQAAVSDNVIRDLRAQVTAQLNTHTHTHTHTHAHTHT
jgi:hypothetical protein